MTLLSQCAASGQMDSRQINAHQIAGELPGEVIGYEAGTYYAELDEPPVTQESAFAWLSPGFKLAMVLLAAVACATYFVLRYPRLPLWAVANYFMGAV